MAEGAVWPAKMSEETSLTGAARPDATLSQVKVLLAGRLAVVSFYMGLVVFYHYRYLAGSDIPPNLAPVAVAYALSAFYTIALQFINNLSRYVLLQLFIDILLISAMIFYTGGVQSPFSFMYLFVIIAVAILLSTRAIFTITTVAAAFYTLLLALEFYGKIHPHFAFLVTGLSANSGYFFVTGIMNISAFYLIAFLSGYLADLLRKSGQQLIQASEDFTALKEFHENVLTNMGSGMLAIDLAGAILSCNPAAAKILGKEARHLIRTDATKALMLPEFSGYVDSLGVKSPVPQQFDWLYRSSNGRAINLTMTANGFEAGSQVKGAVVVFQDVTKIKSMERRMAHAERLATIGRMAAGMAHEIRNPLASLSGSIQVLSNDLKPLMGASEKRLIEITNREVKRLNKTITQFLDYASPAEGYPVATNISDILSDTITLMRTSPEVGDRITIDEKLDPSLWAEIDQEQFKQVVWNLLSNAVESIEDTGAISVVAKKEKGPINLEDSSPDLANTSTIIFSISDTGKGIELEDIDKIFDPFFTNKIGGTGLGLAACFKSIQSFRGDIRVESKVDEGSTFIVRLPDCKG